MLVVDQGWIRDAKVRSHPEPGTAHGKLGTINVIIVHQTDSSTAASTLSEYESSTRTTKPKGTGAHFLIDKDGTIYQTASLEQKCWHVRPIYSRCYEQHTCTPLESKFYAGLLKQTGGGKPFVMGSYSHEKMKSYPDRYPMNEDSIGIEIVGRFLGKSNRDAMFLTRRRRRSSRHRCSGS